MSNALPESDVLRVVRRGAVTWITINRPHALNAVHPPLHEALQQGFDDFAADPSQRVCVLTGAGERAFCVGSDLKYIAQRREGSDTPQPTPMPRSGYAGLIERFDLAKPIIAVVNGLALGGGFEIALACDLIIASRGARFGLPEAKVGGFAVGGGAHRLARQLPLKRAMAMILTGDAITADEAFALGLVNEVVDFADLEQAALRWCEKLLACAPAAAALSKQAILRGLDEPGLVAALQRQVDYPEYATWLAANEIREGAMAFVEKRPPRWKTGIPDDEEGLW